MRFMLSGCDISFVAEAPENMTVKQLVEQADRIVPDWCACGVCSLEDDRWETEIVFDYDDVRKADPSAPCTIKVKGV